MRSSTFALAFAAIFSDMALEAFVLGAENAHAALRTIPIRILASFAFASFVFASSSSSTAAIVFCRATFEALVFRGKYVHMAFRAFPVARWDTTSTCIFTM